MRQQLDKNQLRQNLHHVVDDIEKLLQDMSDTTGEQAGDLKWRAGKQLHEARERLSAASQRTQDYVQQHPWAVIGGTTAMAFLLGMISKTRH